MNGFAGGVLKNNQEGQLRLADSPYELMEGIVGQKVNTLMSHSKGFGVSEGGKRPVSSALLSVDR